jgi:hypothetical protein
MREIGIVTKLSLSEAKNLESGSHPLFHVTILPTSFSVVSSKRIPREKKSPERCGYTNVIGELHTNKIAI